MFETLFSSLSLQVELDGFNNALKALQAEYTEEMDQVVWDWSWELEDDHIAYANTLTPAVA